VQGSVNDTNERHPAFDLSFNDNTVKATRMGWGKASPQDQTDVLLIVAKARSATIMPELCVIA
jgi:hypothetical protein